MGAVYLLTLLILLISFILVKKTDKEIDIIGFISISIVIIFCYNTFICYILTFFTIPITLWILSLINLIITLLFFVVINKTKQIQKYVFNKIEMICISIIAIVALVVSYMNFDFPFNIKYETSDPSVHYLTSVMFAESDALLSAVEDDEVYGSFNARKTVSYVNSGLLMKCFCANLEPMECYNIFVLFGMFTLFLTGTTIFSAMINFSKKKEHIFWALILSIICILGYPLNSFLFGFEYLSMGLLIICVIINLIYYYEKGILDIKYFVLIMTLLNFGLFCSYYMFVPFVYPALWIYFYIKNYQKNKKIITKEIIILWFITLLIPFILGFIYHLEPDIYAIFIKNSTVSTKMKYSTHLVNSAFATNGYIYINLYSNMLLLLPLPIYLFIKTIQNKNIKNDLFIPLLLIFTMIFIGILLIANSFEKVSIYYLSKNYFALWIILLYCNYKALIELSQKSNYLPRLFIGAYVLLMIICTIFSDIKLIDDALENKNEDLLSVMEIFGANKTMLLKKQEQLNQDEIDLLMYAREKLDYNSEIEVVADRKSYYWSYALIRYINHEEILEIIPKGQDKLNAKVYFLDNKINRVDYMIYFNKSKRYNELKDILFKNSEIIYENSSGGILRYKN